MPIRAADVAGGATAALHTLPAHPSWVPYRTSYYDDDWGFCLVPVSARPDATGEYEAVIDSTLARKPDLGECVLPAGSEEEVSSRATLATLRSRTTTSPEWQWRPSWRADLAKVRASLHWRFLFAPGTIGAIAWLARNRGDPADRSGLACPSPAWGTGPGVTTSGAGGGNAEVDRTPEVVLRAAAGTRGPVRPLRQRRAQFCSPGFDMPVGALTRSGHGTSETHHTSGDDLAWCFLPASRTPCGPRWGPSTPLEANALVTSRSPKCEPQLGRRGLYRNLGGRPPGGSRVGAAMGHEPAATGETRSSASPGAAAIPFVVLGSGPGAGGGRAPAARRGNTPQLGAVRRRGVQ